MAGVARRKAPRSVNSNKVLAGAQARWRQRAVKEAGQVHGLQLTRLPERAPTAELAKTESPLLAVTERNSDLEEVTFFLNLPEHVCAC